VTATIPHNRPTVGKEEAAAAAKVIETGYLAGGQQTPLFEDEICEFLGLPAGHAVAVTSGSSALFLALKVLGLGQRPVAIPSYVCSSLKHACVMNQCRPTYLDNQADLPVVDTTSATNASALIYPYMYGFASALPSHQCVIEDLAQALGASYGGQKLGTLGDIGVLSFYATKMLTSGGQGGMLVSKDKAMIDAARDFLEFDQRVDDQARFNLHITEVQAAIGRVQLRRLPDFIEKRAELWDIYQSYGLPLLDINDNKAQHVRYRVIVKTPSPENLVKFLHQQQVTAINPFNETELLDKGSINAAKLCRQTVSLPLYPSLTLEQAKYIAEHTRIGLDL